jgi:hypothetical protein
MTRGLRSLLALAVLGGLGWYVWKYESGARPDPKRVAPPWKAEPGDVVKFELKDLGTGLALACERAPGGTWWITAPARLEADPEQVEQVVRHLATPDMERRLEAPSDLAPFGLAQPKVRITFATKDGKSVAAILGGKNPSDTAYFMLPEGGATPYTIATWSGDHWKKTVTDLRQKRFVGVEPAKVTRIVVDRPGESPAARRIEIVRDGAEGWRLAAPAAVRADRYVVDGILSDLVALRGEAVMEEPQAYSKYRLDQPHARIVLSTGTGTGQTVVFSRPKDGQTYASSTRLPEAWKIAGAAVLDTVLKPVDEFRERLLLQADKEDLTGLTLEVPGFSLKAAGGKDGWKVIEPAGRADAGGSDLDDALFEFIYVRAEAFGPDAPASLKPYGLAPKPAAVITLTGTKDKTAFIHRYELGARAGDKAWCRFGDAKGVVQVRKDLLDRALRLADKVRTAGEAKKPPPDTKP